MGWRARPKEDPHTNLKQSNFILPVAQVKDDELSHHTDTSAGEDEGNSSDTLDPEFLSALPSDVRAEIMAEHRQKVLQRKGVLVTSVPLSKQAKKPDSELVQQKLRLPKRDKRPTFTTRELSTPAELRATLKDWHDAFEEDGPIEGDVAALERYLVRVVADERDLEKVVGVVRWLRWLVGDCNRYVVGKNNWEGAIKGIERKIQEAVQERGLGKLVL